MRFVEVEQAATNFSRLLAEVEEHNEIVVICRNGTPVANLAPHSRRRRSRTDRADSQLDLGLGGGDP